MSRTKGTLPRLGLLLGLGCAGTEADAGAFHRCDDGSGVSIYQTRPCDAATRAVARHEYPDAASPGPEAEGDASPSTGKRMRTERRNGRRDGGSRPAASGGSKAAAWECSERGRRWLQDRPCGEGGSEDGRAAGKATVTRRELCRRLRAESGRAAPQERSSDAAYRRNLLRARGGC